MSEEHVHEWILTWRHSGPEWVCKDFKKCQGFLSLEEITTRLNEYEKLKRDYYELIMAVGNKYEGEIRHETALRYILEAERGSNVAYADILEGKP